MESEGKRLSFISEKRFQEKHRKTEIETKRLAHWLNNPNYANKFHLSSISISVRTISLVIDSTHGQGPSQKDETIKVNWMFFFFSSCFHSLSGARKWSEHLNFFLESRLRRNNMPTRCCCVRKKKMFMAKRFEWWENWIRKALQLSKSASRLNIFLFRCFFTTRKYFSLKFFLRENTSKSKGAKQMVESVRTALAFCNWNITHNRLEQCKHEWLLFWPQNNFALSRNFRVAVMKVVQVICFLSLSLII